MREHGVVRLSLRWKLASGLGLVVVATAIVGWAGLRGMSDANRVARRVHDHNVRGLAELQQATEHAKTLREAVLLHVITGDREEMARLERAMAASEVQVDRTFAELARLWRDEPRLVSGLDHLRDRWQAYLAIKDRRTIPASRAGRPDEARSVAAGPGEERFVSFDAAFHDLVALNDDIVSEAVDSAAAEFGRTRRLTVAMYSAVAALALLVVVMLFRSVARPARAVAAAARAMEAGDFTRRADVHSDDELGDMAAAFNAMAGRIAEMVASLERLGAEAAEARDEAHRASASKSTFLATMSHEMRTPLNSVIGMTQLLEQTSLDGRQRELVGGVRQAGEALLALVGDLLDLTRIEAGRFELDEGDVHLAGLVDAVADIVEEPARAKGISVVRAVDPVLPRVLVGDNDRLRQVLLNLAGNAVKFSERGVVAIRAAVEDAGDERVVVRFEVADEGPGIRPEDQESVFELFFQADSSATRRYEGTGLGLAISRQLVELMGGEIGVRSVLGRGSTFWFRVPLGRPQKAGRPASPLAGVVRPHTPPRRGRVLVVDDDAGSRLVAVGLLEALGWSAEAVADGGAALDALARGGYDAVLLDLQMPDLDGIEITRRLRSSGGPGASLRVVATTAAATPADRDRCLAAGMDAFVAKPIRLPDLEQALATVGPPPPPDAVEGLDVPRWEFLGGLGRRGDVRAEVVRMFVEEAPHRLAAVRSAAVAGDHRDLLTAAHALKGASSNVGATALADAATALEERARADVPDGTQALVESVARELGRVVERLSAWLDAHEADAPSRVSRPGP